MNLRVSGISPASIRGRRLWLLILLSLWGTGGWPARAEPVLTVALDNAVAAQVNEPNDGRMTQQPSVRELGNDRFSIGAITVDRSKRLITVPGSMIPYEEGKPIEFVATMRQGYKAYESVLTLDVTAFEFNLACILIGLDADKASNVEYHFDPNPITGDRVSIRVGWQRDGQWVEMDVAELVKVGAEKPATPSVWVYTGSRFVDGDRYLAQMDGVLIGLIHDPASIIEHREGIGIGDWGSIAIDAELAPAGGQEIVLQIQAVD
jgi:hypothetical protein